MNPAGVATGEVVLRCDGVRRFLGKDENRVEALRGVSFAARRGEVTAIVGPSGCGKSTLLYQLGLLDRPDAGEIEVGGRAMSGASDEERTAARAAHLGFVFQFHYLLLEFSALENVIVPMRKRGRLGEGAMRERARALLEAVGLDEKRDRLGAHLSGGEQQRVAIARALANEPDAILADEPTGNLDQANSDRIFAMLMRLAKDTGQAVVMVTHNVELAERCDRILKMRDGVFVEDRRPNAAAY